MAWTLCGLFSEPINWYVTGTAAPNLPVTVRVRAGANPVNTDPLATLGTSPTVTSGGANPVNTDGLGNLRFWMLPGRVDLWANGQYVTTVEVAPDPADPSFGGAPSEPFLVPTTVKTANYTASPQDYVPVDTTTGAVTVTLPSAPTDKTRVGVELVKQGGSNAVTVAAGGTDVFDVATGPTSLTLSVLKQALVLQYASSTGIWYAQSNNTVVPVLTGAAGGDLAGTYPNPTVAQATNAFTAKKALVQTRIAQTLTVSGAVTIDASTGNIQDVVLGATTAFNATSTTITSPSTGQKLTLRFVQGTSGAATYAWPTNWKWPSGAPSPIVLANQWQSATAVYDGTNWNVEDLSGTSLPVAPSETTLASPLAVCTQVAGYPILSGTQTPRGTSGLLTVGAAGWNFGVAVVGYGVLYGQVAFPLYQAASNNGAVNPVGGATFAKAGGPGVDLVGNFGRSFVISGLTPGQPLNWTVNVGIAAPMTKLNLPGAFRIAITPDRTKAYVTDFTNSQVHVVNLGGTQGYTYYRGVLAQPGDTGRGFHYDHEYKCVVVGGTNPRDVAVTPDGTKVVVPNNAGTVTVINTATETVQGTYTMPGVSPKPWSVVCPNNTTAYISDNTNNVVYPFTIATGVFGTAITVGAGPKYMCATPNGAEVYVPNSASSATQNSVSVIATASNTVTNTVVLFNNGVNTIGPVSCAATQDGASVWVAVQGAAATGGQRIYQILTATHAVGVVSDPTPSPGNAFQTISIDGSTNGRSDGAAIPAATAWVFDTGGVAVQYWIATPAPQGGGGGAYAGKVFTSITTGSNIGGSAIDNHGNIFFADFTANQMGNWPGGTHELMVSGTTIANHFLNVDWQDTA